MVAARHRPQPATAMRAAWWLLALVIGAGATTATTTTPLAGATYGYDAVAQNAQDAVSAARVSARMDALPPTNPSRRSANRRFADFVAANAGTAVVRYDADFALGQLTRGGSAKASDLVDFGKAQGWTRVQTATGPIKYVDANDVTRLTIKRGSPRAPGSNFPHVEMRNVAGQRIDAFGNVVTRRSPGNHTPIQWDLP